MQYGYFDDARREYVITDPKTPVKWINYIGTLAFGGFVDHTGGALLCKQDPALNRITKYIPQTPAGDFKGSTLYLRRHTEAGYELVSPFFTPCLTALDRYECRVGLGYTRILSEKDGLACDVTIFVPRGKACELRLVKVSNNNSHPLTVDAVPVVEFTHFDALKQFTNADWVPQTMQSDAVRTPGGQVILLQYAFMKRDTALNYFTASLPASSFETERQHFLGGHEYTTWGQPLALKAAELGCHEARRGDNIGALMLPLGTLKPGESRRFVVLLGQEADRQAVMAEADALGRPGAAEAALAELASGWNSLLNRQQVQTPDAAMNAMLNIHNPRQCMTTLNWSRYLSLYQLGFGARGIGYRDSAQDALGAMSLAPEQARDLLLMLLQVQKRDGSAMHQLNPLTLVATEGDSREREDRPHYYCDDHLWAVLTACAYLKETGDFSLLDRVLPFYEKDKQGVALEQASVYDHLSRALTFTRQNTGAHGLPLLGFADWNDTMNLPTGSESLLAACLYGRALQEMIGLAEFLGKTAQAAEWRGDYDIMRGRVEQWGWDGAWYRSYYDETGQPLGSAQNDAGQIYTYGQAWPVMAGFASPEHAQSALEAVAARLSTDFGIKLSAPGFNGFDPSRGGITTYPPGAKENGGIFLHVNPWVMVAEALVGNSERAFRYYRQTNPAGRNDQIEIYECEPYVYPQNILGDEHPQFGLARNSWLSGTAAWMYLATTQYLLGVQPAYQGLRVTPCIPAEWDGFKATRQFRGATYEIEVVNPQHVARGRVQLELDGRPVEGDILPVLPAGSSGRVKATLLFG
ncbi:MAG TPA: hypothetical protein PKW33_04060 [Anaerolineaceae bacterium]|nr:hypothetical protein [Anaerolineaceae bacterium]HPN50736.1 hypothetical protein [Anaerolineaceae bacterium]